MTTWRLVDLFYCKYTAFHERDIEDFEQILHSDHDEKFDDFETGDALIPCVERMVGIYDLSLFEVIFDTSRNDKHHVRHQKMK